MAEYAYKSEQFLIACKQNTDKLLKITTFFGKVGSFYETTIKVYLELVHLIFDFRNQSII